MNYRVKVLFRGEGVALGDSKYLGGRYDNALGRGISQWVQWLWVNYGVRVGEQWTELRRLEA